MKRERRFDKRGHLAMRADFWGMLFCVDEPAEDFEIVGDAAIVTVEGPLAQHAEWFWDSFDAIRDRVGAALDSSASTVILKIDSPGGDVAGCFETVRDLRARAAASGKRVIAYADGMAASAGYALACIAEKIYAPSSAFVGSVGVISTMLDVTGLNASIGLRFQLVTSGRKKGYGNPNQPITDAAIAEEQAHVDALAETFYATVSESRGISVEDVRALEAGCFVGAEAERVRLIDQVCTFDELLAMVASGSETTAPAGASEAAMGWKDEMQKAADEGDEEAKKCLDALAAEEETDGNKDKNNPAPESEEQTPPAENKDKDKDKDKGASASKSVEARLAKIEEDKERDRLLASRPDLMKNKAMRAKMLVAPIEALRWNVANLPKVAEQTAPAPAAASAAVAKTSPTAHAAATVPAITRAKQEGGVNGSVTHRSEQAKDMDRIMGLASDEDHVVDERNTRAIRLMTPSQARKHVKVIEARKAAGG